MKLKKMYVSEKTLNELKKLGRLSQSHENIIIDLIKHVIACGRFWSTRN